ncbi:hypothetical protein ACR6C2_16375 [Streptomyces sp. INA 01156]
MIGDLALQGGLQHPLGQHLLGVAPSGTARPAGQLQPVRTGAVHQHRDQLLVRRRTRRRLDRLLSGLRLNDGVGHLWRLLGHQIRR